MRFQDKALEVVSEVLKEDCKVSVEEYDVGTLRLVWFSKTLQHWKALVFATKAGRYVEVTYNGDIDSYYVDVYVKEMDIECYDNDSEMLITNTSMADTHEVPVYVGSHKVDTVGMTKGTNTGSVTTKEVDISLVTESVKSVN
mgnify:CR=1 FL=1